MKRLGVAQVIPRGDYVPQRVAGVVTAMLADPTYAERARGAAEQANSEHGVDAACNALEKLYAETREALRR